MRESLVVAAVAGAAFLLSPILTDTAATAQKIMEVQARINRMEETPTPVYEHYPNPEQKKLSILSP
jgi:hypothetical protein